MRFQAGQPEIPLVPARGGTLVEPEVTVSVLLDAAFGATPGNIVQRGNVGWFAGPGGGGTGTVTQVAGAGLLTGTVTSIGSISIANGTPNTLIGYGSGGVASGITLAGAVSLSGGVLTVTSASPGGTTGQIQVNTSGSFTGVTASGDATINTATGAVTVTKTNGVAFAPSATTDTTVATNISSGTLSAARLPTITGDFTINSSGVGTATKTNGVLFAPSATSDTTNANNIISGTVAIARLPALVASGASHQAGYAPDPGVTPGTIRFLREDATWVVPPGGSGTINTGAATNLAVYTGSGTTVGPLAQSALSIPSSQITGLAASATTNTVNATNITSGVLPLAQLPVTGLNITQHTGTLITSVQSGGTITYNWSLGDTQTATMTANATIAFGSPAVGQSVLLTIVQAASGGPYTISGWPSGISWVGATGPPIASTNAGNALLVKIYCVSSGVYYGWNLGITGETPSVTTITEVSQTSSFTATVGAFYLISGSSAVTATLPTAAGIAGQTIRIRCANGYTGLCTITGTGGQTISGATTRIILAGESPLLQSDGTNWVRTGGTIIPCAAQLYLSTNQSPSLVNGTPTTVQLNTIGFDNTGQMANITSFNIKILRPGQYRVSLAAYVGNISTATSDLYSSLIQLYKNGSGANASAQVVVPGTGATFSFIPSATGSLTCAAGDLLTSNIFVSHTGAQAIPLAATNQTYLEVEEIPSW